MNDTKDNICFLCSCKLNDTPPIHNVSIHNIYCNNCDIYYMFSNNTIFAKKNLKVNSILIVLSIHLRGLGCSLYVMEVDDYYACNNVISELFIEKYPITLDVYDNNNYVKYLNFYYNRCLKFIDNLIFY